VSDDNDHVRQRETMNRWIQNVESLTVLAMLIVLFLWMSSDVVAWFFNKVAELVGVE